MKGIGSFLVLMGAGSAVLHFMNMEFRLLMWIETWGTGVAWAIRGGLVVVGLGMLLLGRKSEPVAQ
jgi:hypothetical protein